MADAPRKKSPRAPSIALDEAIDRAIKVYEKERRHAAPTDVIAQDLGYKSANNGAALAVLASLRYYGLLERPQEGKLAATKDVESYQFAPSDAVKRELLLRWLRSPQIFAELLEKYEGGLPSDGNIRFDLIQRGFSPEAAGSVITVFRRSVEFARYYDSEVAQLSGEGPDDSQQSIDSVERTEPDSVPEIPTRKSVTDKPGIDISAESDLDRIPVRLTGGRRAWLLIPTPFFSIDKKRLKAQIDLLLTEDEDEPESTHPSK